MKHVVLPIFLTSTTLTGCAVFEDVVIGLGQVADQARGGPEFVYTSVESSIGDAFLGTNAPVGLPVLHRIHWASLTAEDTGLPITSFYPERVLGSATIQGEAMQVDDIVLSPSGDYFFVETSYPLSGSRGRVSDFIMGNMGLRTIEGVTSAPILERGEGDEIPVGYSSTSVSVLHSEACPMQGGRADLVAGLRATFGPTVDINITSYGEFNLQPTLLVPLQEDFRVVGWRADDALLIELTMRYEGRYILSSFPGAELTLTGEITRAAGLIRSGTGVWEIDDCTPSLSDVVPETPPTRDLAVDSGGSLLLDRRELGLLSFPDVVLSARRVSAVAGPVR